MNEKEAYGERTYGQRALTCYQVGDVVRIGPAYQMSGVYAPDGWEGVHTVLGVLPGSPTPDYYVARGEIVNPQKENWEGIVHPSRLMLVRSAA